MYIEHTFAVCEQEEHAAHAVFEPTASPHHHFIVRFFGIEID
jgi:hypothetical protein